MPHKPPTICRQCKSVITGQHTLNECTAIQIDLALEKHKATRRAAEDQAQAMRLQHQYKSAEYA